MHCFDMIRLSYKASTLAVALSAAIVCAGCQSPMYSGTAEDGFGRGPAPTYSPGTYEPPYQVGGQSEEQSEEEEVEPPLQAEADQKYQYRGGRDPVTGRAKTQM